MARPQRTLDLYLTTDECKALIPIRDEVLDQVFDGLIEIFGMPVDAIVISSTRV